MAAELLARRAEIKDSTQLSLNREKLRFWELPSGNSLVIQILEVVNVEAAALEHLVRLIYEIPSF